MSKYKKIEINKDFDYVGGYIGGFDDIPTKQDKFKPIENILVEYDDGTEEELTDLYQLNPKKKQSIKDFEIKFSEVLKHNLTKEHPYKKNIPLEVVINVKMSKKRFSSVDIDNIAKCVLDIMKGCVFEDDSQIQSLFIYKEIFKAVPLPKDLQEYTGTKEIPEGLSGIIVGIRKLDTKDSLLGGKEFYHEVDITEEEYLESKKKEDEKNKEVVKVEGTKEDKKG